MEKGEEEVWEAGDTEDKGTRQEEEEREKNIGQDTEVESWRRTHTETDWSHVQFCYSKPGGRMIVNLEISGV